MSEAYEHRYVDDITEAELCVLGAEGWHFASRAEVRMDGLGAVRVLVSGMMERAVRSRGCPAPSHDPRP